MVEENETTKLEQARKVIQEWVDKQGHERCWYYPDLFNELVKVFDIKVSNELKLPPREEFKKGCEKYQNEEYGVDLKED